MGAVRLSILPEIARFSKQSVKWLKFLLYIFEKNDGTGYRSKYQTKGTKFKLPFI